MPRLATMVLMLVVMFMLIQNARSASTWRWIAGGSEGKQVGEVAQLRAEPEEGPPAGAKTPDPEEEIFGTDRDIEEWEGIQEEFQAISDRTTEMQVEEMMAYWRMVGWVNRQSPEDLRKRARKDLVFNDLMSAPNKYRGRLVHLDLNVRRVLRQPAAADNLAGVKEVYELIGATTESQAWLYMVITPKIPPEMPVGPDVYERARVDGYFLKLQGYYPGGAAPDSKPLVAPVIIGHVTYLPAPSIRESNRDGKWTYIICAAVLLVLIVSSATRLFRKKRKKPEELKFDKVKSEVPFESWLSDPIDPVEALKNSRALAGPDASGEHYKPSDN